jgi:hypothetical protein
MDRSLKAPRNRQRYTCTLEVAGTQEAHRGDTGENVILVATTSGKNLLSLSISREISQHITSTLAQATPLINIDGSVTIMLHDEFQQNDQGKSVPLDQLIAKAISPEMLEDEPQAAQHLSEFRTRLIKSLEHVDEAIASLPKP